MNKEPITLNGLNKLKEELVFLKEKKRPEIVAAIAEARSHGDLKENAEYHAAKEEQSHNEGRITEINDIIARANVIDVTKLNNDGKIIFAMSVAHSFKIFVNIFFLKTILFGGCKIHTSTKPLLSSTDIPCIKMHSGN